ncbi:PF06568 domain protein [Bordetella bronchiseptica E014]|uniref:DUF1127 domain-containing protein n=1 Tax=Bordetella bronchiseptica TaxID=518 RepID=UPI00045990FF|nr:DUF1127 domain-containing protein [Bordetella bronchiseptica]KCV58845.1 PF06568 domain protein [Bordetella bronchiseptica 7E71]KDC21497.1 PF06568 domain protein [Bordetella bronchiseptica E014]
MAETTCSPVILSPCTLCAGAGAGAGAEPASGWRARLRAWIARRRQARILAEVMEMDEHMLNDIGAPPWIKVEAAARQARQRCGPSRSW